MTRQETEQASIQYSCAHPSEYDDGRFDQTELEWAFEAGAVWMKEQLLKNVVLETKVMKDADGDGIETPLEEWLTLENTEIPYIPENLGLKDGDKVKLILIKNE